MAGRCVILVVSLLVLGYTTSLPVSQRTNIPKECVVEDRRLGITLTCLIDSTNFNRVLRETKQPKYSKIFLFIENNFLHFQFGDGVFHPHLKYLGIKGDMFSISPRTFGGLSKLKELLVNRHLTSDSTLFKNKIQYLYNNEINVTSYPEDMNSTAPLFGVGWLEPLIALQKLSIFKTNISSFRAQEFCLLNQLQKLDLSQDRINSTEGLGITCNSVLCTPCLPNVTQLDVSHNPISDFTLNVSTHLPNLEFFNISHCILSHLYFNAATSKTINKLDVSYNKLNSLLIDDINFCDRLHLQELWLQNNQLQTLFPQLFSCMPNLLILDLSKNGLTQEVLINASLNSLTKLKSLDLSYNDINVLQPTLIGNLRELLVFSCTACNLTKVQNDTFSHLSNLYFLVLNNNNLSKIEDGPFSYFKGLQRMSLSMNGLHEITLTENLFSLKVLDLSNNLLSEIPDFSGSWIHLSILALNGNQITRLFPKQILGLSNLKFLSLAFNKIELIPANALSNQNGLQKLDLSNNRIKIISELGFDGLSSLTHLKLENNAIMELPLKLYNMQNLMFMNVSGNIIKSVAFAYAGSPLRGIDLSHNRISEMKGFGLLLFFHLKYVNLSYNQLSRLEYNPFLTFTLPRPSVYLEGNPLHVDCHSEWLLDTKLDMTYKNILYGKRKKYGMVMKDTPSSRRRDREDPYINTVKNIYVIRTRRLAKIADLDILQCTTATGEKKSISEMSDTDFVCQYSSFCQNTDCMEKCCFDDDCPCSTFCFPECTCYNHLYNHSVNFMNCSSRNMTSLPSIQPSHVRSITIDGNYLTSLNSSSLNFPHLVRLNATNSHISHLQPRVFSNLKMLQTLHLEHNNLKEISKHTFSSLVNLEQLYLQENKIHHIDNGSFDDLVHLKLLWLHGNSLEHLHFSLLERTYFLREITLYDNPWLCDCQYGPELKEFLTHSDIIVSRLDIYCNNTVTSDVDDNPGLASSRYNMTDDMASSQYQAVIGIDFTSCTNSSIIEKVYHRTVVERVHSKSITEVVSLAVVVIVMAFIILVIYKNRLLLRVWFYNKYGVHFHQGEDNNDEKPYDLFIAYAKADERLLMHGLLPNLEEGDISYKVCVECRDWYPGTATTDSVVASVQLSKRTIVLVTPKHLDTQWCEYSFDAAHYQVLKDKQLRLILVLTDLELEARMTRAMKLYMKTNAFLVIGEKWFWDKLRYYLAVNPRGADHVVGREFKLLNAY